MPQAAYWSWARRLLVLALALSVATPASASLLCPVWFQRLIGRQVGKPTRVQAAAHPYTTGYRIVPDPVRQTAERDRALGAFDDLVASRLMMRKLVRKVDAWVDSPEKALYLYQNLKDFGARGPRILSYLLKNNPHFKDAYQIKGSPDSLITFSFEKESTSAVITRWYRPARYTEEEWLAMSDSDRTEILAKVLGWLPKQFAPPDRIVPTREKPLALRGPSHEISSRKMWEVTHQGHEFSLSQLMKHVREVGDKIGDYAGIHAHVVFELPEEYTRTPEFSAWVKQLNDHLMLQKLAAGYLPAKYLRIVESGGTQPRWRWPFLYARDLPASVSEINRNRFKPFMVGVRGRIYGPSTRKGFVRIGLELRDSAGSAEQLQAQLELVAAAVRDRIWEKRPASDLPTAKAAGLTTDPIPTALEAMVTWGIDRDFAKHYLAGSHPVYLPFKSYEDGRFYDYGTGAYRELGEADRKRLRDARNIYLLGVYNLQLESQKAAKEGKPWDRKKLDWETTKNLTYWAQNSRLHELYDGLGPARKSSQSSGGTGTRSATR